MSFHEWRQGDYLITDDPARVDRDVVQDFLQNESYWARGRTRETIEQSIDNSIPFGIYHLPTGKQVGFARAITDRATFAWIADVFVLPGHRGQGLSKWLMATILAHPELQGLRQWLLATRDAHTLYEQFGFVRFDEETRSRFLRIFNGDGPRSTEAANTGN